MPKGLRERLEILVRLQGGVSKETAPLLADKIINEFLAVLPEIEQILSKTINTTELYVRSAFRGEIDEQKLYEMEDKIKNQALTDIRKAVSDGK